MIRVVRGVTARKRRDTICDIMIHKIFQSSKHTLLACERKENSRVQLDLHVREQTLEALGGCSAGKMKLSRTPSHSLANVGVEMVVPTRPRTSTYVDVGAKIALTLGGHVHNGMATT